MIKLKNIERVYKSDTRSKAVLKNVSLEVKKGEFLVIMGKSGSGKSTLMNMITGVDKPTGGMVRINKTDFSGYKEGKLAEWRGKNIGIVFQFFQLIPTLTILENIILPMDLVKRIKSKERKYRAVELLEKVGILEHANKMPSALSGGEQQRAAIARALANDAPLIVADEPTGNLDSANSDIILDLFARLNKEGKTVVMVTHEPEMIKGAGRKIVIKDGEIVDDLNLKTGVAKK